MAKRSDITPELCRQLLRYEPETGKLFWRSRPASMYSDSVCHGGVRTAQWAAGAWNNRHSGGEAFTAKTDGYHVGTILGVMVRAHRVAWAIIYGAWPTAQLDHMNGDRADNRLANLRAVTNFQNHRNEGMSKNNTSGVNGVCWDKQTGKWRATIKIAGRNVCLGRHESKEAAIGARLDANERFGFTARHGT